MVSKRRIIYSYSFYLSNSHILRAEVKVLANEMQIMKNVDSDKNVKHWKKLDELDLVFQAHYLWD